jgi:hypothetical protein
MKVAGKLIRKDMMDADVSAEKAKISSRVQRRVLEEEECYLGERGRLNLKVKKRDKASTMCFLRRVW